MTMRSKANLEPYTDTSYQVWVRTPQGALFMWRDRLTYSMAQAWAVEWNKQAPSDQFTGSEFIAVKATTTYEEI